MPGRILKKAPLKVLDGGYGSFSGLELSGGKKITSVAKTKANGRTAITVTFADGNIYVLSCIKGNGTLSDIKEYWNGEPLYDYGEGS